MSSKVFCSECKFYVSKWETPHQAWDECRASPLEETVHRETWFSRGTSTFGWFKPSERNSKNNCRYFEAK